MSRKELEDRFLHVLEENGHLKDHLHRNDEELQKLYAKLQKMESDQNRLGSASGRAPAMAEELRRKVQRLQRRNEELKQHDRNARQLLSLHASSCYPKHSGKRKGGGKDPDGLLEEARAEIWNLKRNNALLQGHVKEVEGASEKLREKLRNTEAEYERKLLRAQQNEASKMWSHVDRNLLKLRQITEKSQSVVELQEKLSRMYERQTALEVRNRTAAMQLGDLVAQLDNEKEKSAQLERQLQVLVADDSADVLRQHVAQVSEERDLLREKIANLVEVKDPLALRSDGREKRSRLDKQVQVSIVEDRVGLLAEVNEERDLLREKIAKLTCREELSSLADVVEGNDAWLLVKRARDRRDAEVQTEAAVEAGNPASSVRELQDAYETTRNKLEKSQKLLSTERRINRTYKLRLEDLTRKAQERYAQTLGQPDERPEGTVDPEAQPGEKETWEESVHLERGRKLVELQIVGASLSPSALQLLGEREPVTFCTYVFFRFDVHGTPLARGRNPRYSFTSEYIVDADDGFLAYVSTSSVLVELHQKLVGCKWRTVATARLPLRQLCGPDGNAEGNVPLVDLSDRALPFGSLDYRIRLNPAATEELSEQSPV